MNTNWRAVAHPVTWAAVLLMGVNDHLLKPRWDHPLTGKLSDVAWLILVPLVLAGLFAPRSTRRGPRLAAIGVTSVGYTALQLWPALGNTFGTAHVADVADLWMLPAVLIPLLVWHVRAAHFAAPLALPVVVVTLVADSPSDDPPDTSWPCGETTWPTDDGLALRMNGLNGASNDALVRGMSLVREDEGGGSVDVPIVVSVYGDIAVVCARDGLEPASTYTWTFGPWEGGEGHQIALAYALEGAVTFHTNDREGVPAATAEDCARLEPAPPTDDACSWNWEPDSGAY